MCAARTCTLCAMPKTLASSCARTCIHTLTVCHVATFFPPDKSYNTGKHPKVLWGRLIDCKAVGGIDCEHSSVPSHVYFFAASTPAFVMPRADTGRGNIQRETAGATDRTLRVSAKSTPQAAALVHVAQRKHRRRTFKSRRTTGNLGRFTGAHDTSLMTPSIATNDTSTKNAQALVG